MIYNIIRTAVEAVPELEGKVRPVAEVVDGLPPPFCIFNRLKSEPLRVLNGVTVCTTDTVELGFEAEMIADAEALAEAAERCLMALPGELENGHRVLWVRCGQDEEDALDVATGLMRRPLTVVLCWQ